MADSINSKAKEYYDNDDTGGSLNSNLKDFLVQQGATGKSINTLWRDYAYGEGGTSLNTRLRNLWGTSGSLMKRWKETLGLTWDEVKAFFNFRDIEPDFLLDGSTSFDNNDKIDLGTNTFNIGKDGYSYSISAWFKAPDQDDNSGIFSSQTSSSNEFQILLLASGRLQTHIYDGSTQGTVNTSTDNEYNDNQWHHVVSILDSSADTLSLYVDGSLIGSTTWDEYTTGSLVAQIGARFASSNYFEGRIANVGIWDRVLSASEVESIYWRGSHSELQNTELTNLVSWYDLQGDVLDKQGSNDGTNNGATLNSDSYSGESPFKPRIQDKAAPKMAVQLADGSTSFDGTNDYVDLSNVSNFANLTQGTISLWFKTPDLASYRTLVSGSDRTDGSSECILLLTNFGKIRYVNQENASVAIEVDTTSAFDDNEWHHVALTVDGTGNKIYVDGSLQPVAYVNGSSSTQKFFNDVNDIDSLKIGANEDSGGTETFFNGSIANVAIHSSALTQTQVQELMFTEKYSGLSADLKTNLVSWYDLGDESLGSEKVTNGTFDTDTTGWAGVSGGNVTYDSANQRLINTPDSDYGSARQFMTGFVDGAKYKATWTQEEGNGLVLEGGSGSTWDINGLTYYYPIPSGQQDFTAYFNSVVTGNVTLKFVVQGEVGYLDNMSIKQVFAPDSHGSNTGTPYGAISSSGYTHSPHGVVDPLNFGEVYSGRALSFDGTNDYVTLSKPDFMNGESAFTMSAWALHDDTGSDVIITTDAEFFMGYNTGKLTASYRETDSTRNRKIATDALNSGEWYHLCATWDKSGDGEIKLYVNGYYVAQSYNDGGVSTASVIKNGTSARVGSWVTGSQEMDGKLSSIKVFNTALTESQVRELYTKPETVLPTGVSASNLKLDLPMQEGSGSYIYDGSGNQNHGTISGASWVTGEEYGYQSSLVRSNTPMIFDGSNDIVELGTGLFNGGESQLTISAWAKPETNSGHGKIITKKGTVNPRVFYLSVNGTDKNVYFFLTSTNYRYFYTANDSITVGEWVHIVATYNFATDTGKIYLNGAEVSTSSAGSTPDTSIGSNSIPTTIGRDGGSSADYFKGLINDVGIWDIALDSDSVTALYNSGVPLLPTSDSGNYDNSDSLVGYWRNDGNTTWTDRSTNSNNGTVSGSPVEILIPEGSTEGRDNQGYYLSDTTTISNGIRLHGSEYISIQDSEVLSFGDGIDDRPFSIEAWIKMDDATDFKIINKGIFNSTGEWWLEVDSNDKLGLYLLDESVASTYELALYNTALTSYEGQWIHIGATYDGRGGSSANAGVKLYLNGSSVTTTLSGGGTYVAMENLGADVHIGKYDSTYAKGLIDEVRIYSKELSADEVSKNYTNGLGKHS